MMIYRIYDDKQHEMVQDGDLPMEGEGFRYAHTDADGWIEWKGGECPLPDGTLHEVKSGSGEVMKSDAPEEDCWDMGNIDARIIAYRPILDTKPEAPAWDGEGLPPVGCECECTFAAENHEVWHKGATVLRGVAPEGHEIVAIEVGDHTAVYRSRKHIRPLRSEADRAIEEMMRVMMQDQRGVGIKRFAELLYRAGYRKQGGEA